MIAKKCSRNTKVFYGTPVQENIFLKFNVLYSLSLQSDKSKACNSQPNTEKYQAINNG